LLLTATAAWHDQVAYGNAAAHRPRQLTTPTPGFAQSGQVSAVAPVKRDRGRRADLVGWAVPPSAAV
jgi:hypothetical protein